MCRQACLVTTLCLILTGVSAAPTSASAWGDLWGAMTWGPAIVPGLEPGGLVLLGIALGVVATVALQRGHARNLALGLALVCIALPVALQALTLPNTFVNGTVADADEVNANFDAVRTSIEGGPDITRWGWQSAHFAAAAACRAATPSGGFGCCVNNVRVRDRTVGLNCNQICGTSGEMCDAEVSIGGKPGKAVANGEVVGSFYNYSCSSGGNGGSEASQPESFIDGTTPSFLSYCCCRR